MVKFEEVYIKEELEKGLKDKIQIYRIDVGIPGHKIKIEEVLEIKKVSLGAEILDTEVLSGVGDLIDEYINKIVEGISTMVKGESVFDYEVRIEIGRDTDTQSTLIVADLVYAVPEYRNS